MIAQVVALRTTSTASWRSGVRSARGRPRRGPGPAVAFAFALALGALPRSALGQTSAELEVERRDTTTTSRLEVYDGVTPVLRAERELDAGRIQRIGVMLPGRRVGLDGYASVFLEDRADRLYRGVAFEIGKGVPMLGGSVERGARRFTGAYLKLRRPDAVLGLGGGSLVGAPVAHGALYLKGRRWSAALGGARGDGGVDFQHLAGTWHPEQRGGAPGARFILERRSAQRYSAELMLTDRANFNHFAVWGQFGMDQFPHRKSFEAVGDIMRYVRPPIFLHGYTTGAAAVSARWDRRDGSRELTLDGRFFPFRAFRDDSTLPEPPASRTGVSGYVLDRVLPSLMVGGFRRTRAGETTWVGELGLPPFSLYVEAPERNGARPYLFLQYRGGLPF